MTVGRLVKVWGFCKTMEVSVYVYALVFCFQQKDSFHEIRIFARCDVGDETVVKQSYDFGHCSGWYSENCLQHVMVCFGRQKFHCCFDHYTFSN